MSYTKCALRALLNLSEDEKCRFAYLAVTGKLENALRDHLAFTIQSSHDNVLVGRDLTLDRVGLGANDQHAERSPRLDLVVFDQEGHLTEASEAKLFYTFDYRPNQPANVVGQVHMGVLHDATRLEALPASAPHAAVNLLLLVCHANAQALANHYDKVSKYDLHRPARHQIEDFTPKLLAGFQAELQNWQFESLKSINLGERFGMNVGLTPIIASYNRKLPG